MPALQVVLVVNPRASRVRDQVVTDVVAVWKAAFPTEVVTTDAPGSARAIAADAVGRADVIAVLSGDGTLNEVANGLTATATATAAPVTADAGGLPGPWLAPVPGGSTNVFARSLGLARDPVLASRQLVDAIGRDQATTLGVGRLDGRRFLANAGIGLDAAVVLRADGRPDRKRRWGALWFARCAAAELRTSRATTFRLVVTREGPEEVAEDLVAPEAAGSVHAASWLVVLNRSPYTYAGRRPLDLIGHAGPATAPPSVSSPRFRLRLARQARRPSSDQQAVIEPTHRGLIAVEFDHLAIGTLLVAGARSSLTARGAVGGRHIRATDVEGRLSVRASAPVAAQLDGEYVGRAQRFEFTYEPAAITVVQPTRPPARRRGDS